jgi:hypothetical protein
LDEDEVCALLAATGNARERFFDSADGRDRDVLWGSALRGKRNPLNMRSSEAGSEMLVAATGVVQVDTSTLSCVGKHKASTGS